MDWIRAVEWVPYQLPTFVTPAFAGYVSGHSTFSRAAAEVMTAITGSQYVPGGLASATKLAGDLEVEHGPTRDVELQWASYYDAADQAGISQDLRRHPHLGGRLQRPPHRVRSAASQRGTWPTATSTGPPGPEPSNGRDSRLRPIPDDSTTRDLWVWCVSLHGWP